MTDTLTTIPDAMALPPAGRDLPGPDELPPSALSGQPEADRPASSRRRRDERKGARAAESPERASGGQIIAVTSGKGGVGKSNIAAGLSILLAASGVKVALIDADMGMGNLDVLLGVTGGPTLNDVLAGRRSVQDVLQTLPCGVRLATGSSPTAPGQALDPQRRRALLSNLKAVRDEHDLVILDCGSGLGREVTDFCEIADHVLVATTPEPTALTDAYGMVKSLVVMGYPGRVSVLVNFASDRGEAKQTYARIASVANQFLGRAVYDAGYVLTDPKVPASVRRREPFVLAFPGCPATRCLMTLAVKIRPRGVATRGVHKAGLIRRILEWLE